MKAPNPLTAHGLVIIVIAIYFGFYGLVICLGELGEYFDPPASATIEGEP